MKARLTNAPYIVTFEHDGESFDIIKVENPCGISIQVDDSELDAIIDDLERGKFEAL